MTFEPTLLSVTGINNHRMMFKNNEIDSLTSFDRVKIRDACAHEEHPLDFFYQTCRELFDSNNNASVQKFFYHQKSNVSSIFKPLWPLRYKIQELIGV